MPDKNTDARPLRKILGLGFGLAMAFGGTVGVGILRLPGTLAGTLGDPLLIALFWVLGALYAALGAVAIAELATMMPQAGGFYVYARRAFGRGIGFVVGWNDWGNNVAAIAYASITAAAFLAEIWAPAATSPKLVAIGLVATFSALHWVGLRFSSALTGLISVTVGLMFLGLVIACFAVTPAPHAAAAPLGPTAATLPLGSIAMLGMLAAAMRSVLVTFDGWYSPIYFAEENTNPSTTLPRAIVGGTVLIGAFYLVINLAMLKVLPLPVLAAAVLPAAEAASTVLPSGGALLVKWISLVTVLSLVNATLLMTPRILLAMGRDGLFVRRAASVSAGGAPRPALALTSLAAIALIATGTFEQIVSLAAVLFLLNYLSAYASVFVLRRREPAAIRPYRAIGFPVTTAIVLLGSVLFLAAAVADDHRSGLIAAVLMAAVAALYRVLARLRIRDGGDAAGR